MYKRWALASLAVLAALLLGTAAVTFAVDPFQNYRAAAWFTPLYDNGMQPYFNAGLARHFDYDTPILGTSMTENFRPSLVDEVFGGQSIKLPFEGGMAANHAQVLSLAFTTHDVRRVIYGLDMYSFVRDPAYSAFTMPAYLYDQDPFNDVSYLLNGEVIFHQLPSTLLHNWREPGKLRATRDSMYAWKSDVVYSAATTLSSYDFSQPALGMQPADVYADNVMANFERFVQPYLQAHPDTEFLFFFPPYSALQWYMMQQNGHLDFVLNTKEQLTELLLAYPNVHLYDFTARLDWIDNLDLYTDYAHYTPTLNDEITRCLADEALRVRDIYDVYEANDTLAQVAAAFPVPQPKEE
ncbi:MAG: hypothetical protein LBU67_02240 [Oscillospiraceae bacterium]|nr:hypothetical protein [Oscillospiraceae bacterium]